MSVRIAAFFVFMVISLPSFARISAPTNYHPAFKILSHKQLAEIKPVVGQTVTLSNAVNEPSLDDLHFDEVEPIAQVSLVATASFDSSYLDSSRVLSLDPTQLDIVVSNPVIKINDHDYPLFLVQTILDDDKNIRYITAKVVGRKGYARFVIDNQSAAVVAHLEVDGARYRILSRQTNPTQQLIYRMPPQTAEELRFPTPVVVSNHANSLTYRLERELLKTELLLTMTPSYYHEAKRDIVDYAIIEQAKIAVINLENLQEGRVSKDITEILSRLRLLTGNRESDRFVVTKLTKDKKGRITYITFQQLVDGALFDKKSTMYVHRDGYINHLSLSAINTQHPDFQQPIYNFEQAKMIAENNFFTQDVDKLTTYQDKPFVSYKTWMINKKNNKVIPLWFLIVMNPQSTDDKAYIALVDALSGEAVIAMKYQPKGPDS